MNYTHMKKKVDWIEVKTYYLTHRTATYASTAKKYKIPDITVKVRAVKEKWKTERDEIEKKADILTGDIVVMDIAKFQAAKFRAGQDLAQLGLEKLLTVERWGAVAAKMVAELGWKLSTEALGLDDKTTINNYNQMTQNNMMSIKDLVIAMKQVEADKK